MGPLDQRTPVVPYGTTPDLDHWRHLAELHAAQPRRLASMAARDRAPFGAMAGRDPAIQSRKHQRDSSTFAFAPRTEKRPSFAYKGRQPDRAAQATAARQFSRTAEHLHPCSDFFLFTLAIGGKFRTRPRHLLEPIDRQCVTRGRENASGGPGWNRLHNSPPKSTGSGHGNACVWRRESSILPARHCCLKWPNAG
jgi:hypothetical protein